MFLRKRALARLASEKVLYPRRPGGDIPVCVVYPNTYPLAMANLGFQAIFHIFESDSRVAADRAFLPDRDELATIRAREDHLLSFEGGKPLSDFEILAFSISFETDYLNLLSMLRLAGIPLRREQRKGRNYPLIIAGGSAVFRESRPCGWRLSAGLFQPGVRFFRPSGRRPLFRSGRGARQAPPD